MATINVIKIKEKLELLANKTLILEENVSIFSIK